VREKHCWMATDSADKSKRKTFPPHCFLNSCQAASYATLAWAAEPDRSIGFQHSCMTYREERRIIVYEYEPAYLLRVVIDEKCGASLLPSSLNSEKGAATQRTGLLKCPMKHCPWCDADELPLLKSTVTLHMPQILRKKRIKDCSVQRVFPRPKRM
jgi:hypothetical protein